MKDFFSVLRELKAINIPRGWQRGEEQFLQKVYTELGTSFPDDLVNAYHKDDKRTLMNMRGDVRRLIKKELRQPKPIDNSLLGRMNSWIDKKTGGRF